MAEFLALEWEHDQISGVQAQVSTGRVRVRRTFVLPRPSTSVAGSGAVLAVDWLKTELSKQGITSGDVLVALPRDEAVVKRMELPETSDDELPVIVRFQAAAKSAVPIDDLSLDFIPLPRRNEIPGRQVLMASVPNVTLTEVRTLCEVAGLKLTTLGLTPAAVAEQVARAEASLEDAGGASLLVARYGARLEISVLRRCHLLFSHSARLSVDAGGPEPQAVVSEVSRALVALRGAISDVKIDRAWTLFSQTEHDHVSEVLKRRLACDVQPLDPFPGIEWDRAAPEGVDQTLLVGPIGLLLAKAEPRVPAIDFLSPRKPVVKRDDRKRLLAIAGAAAGVIAALLLVLVWLKLSGLDKQIAEKTASEKAAAEFLAERQSTMDAAAEIDKWDDDEIPWLDEFNALVRHLPNNDRIFLERLDLNPKMAAVSAPGFHLSAFAREEKDYLELHQKLVNADPRYSVSTPKPRASKDQQFYPLQFEIDVFLIEQTPPAKPPSGPPAAAPEKSAAPAPDAKATPNSAANNTSRTEQGRAAS